MPQKTPLREGFTTGTALTAAATAALHLLLHGIRPTTVRVPLPPFTDRAEPAGWLDVPVADVEPQAAADHAGNADAAQRPAAALGIVIKDGGDDPDATHGARIEALVECAPQGLPLAPPAVPPHSRTGADQSAHADAPHEPFDILLDFPFNARSEEPPHIGSHTPYNAPATSMPDTAGTTGATGITGTATPPDGVTILLRAGVGVGRVTLPGLPVPVGEPAINPEPRRQLAAALRATCAEAGWKGTVRVTVRVPEGERMARHTLNGRLGIVGGISILGTRGTVRPYSHDAWQAAVAQGLDVARAAGMHRVCLSTGRRSETLLMRAFPDLPALAFVQAADFAAFSLAAAAQRGFARLEWGCFFGKLVKLAQGLPYTHARTAPLDLEQLAAWAAQAGAGSATCATVAQCNTAGQALDILLTDPAHAAVLHAVTLRARDAAHRWTGNAESVTVTVHLFHMDGRCLTTA